MVPLNINVDRTLSNSTKWISSVTGWPNTGNNQTKADPNSQKRTISDRLFLWHTFCIVQENKDGSSEMIWRGPNDILGGTKLSRELRSSMHRNKPCV